MNASILAGILQHLNPLTLPISVAIHLGIRAAVGPEADPSVRLPQEHDEEAIAWIENYVKNGQQAYQFREYCRYCKLIGVDPKAPFDSSHPLSTVPIK